MKLSNRKDKETEQKEKLEGGFSLYMNGAHKKEKFMPRHTVAKDSRKKKAFNFAPHLLPSPNDLEALRAMNQAQESNSNSNTTTTERGRKKWNSNMSSITIKTQDGANIKIKPNNSESTGATPRISNDSRDSQSNEFMQFDPQHYSYDFESDSMSEQEDGHDKIEEEIADEKASKDNADSKSNVKKSLIEEVKFSDESDLEEEDLDDDNDEDEKCSTIKFQKPLDESVRSKQAIKSFKPTETKQLDESDDGDFT